MPIHQRLYAGWQRLALTIGVAVTAVTLLFFGVTAASASPGDGPSRVKPTIVLVHGAFADSSGWNAEIGIAAHAIGDTERAADLMDRAQATLRDTGRLGLLLHVLGIYNHLLVELGQFGKAGVVVAEANRLAEDTRQPVWTAGTLSTGGRLLAFQGDPDRALRMAEQATRLAGRLNDQLCVAVLAAGAAHLAAGRYVDAFEEHARIFDPNDPAYHWRECFAGIGTMAESAVGAGRVTEARRILAGLEDTARITSAPLLHNQLSYAHAVLADDTDAEPLYHAALATNLTRWPFVQARLELAYGHRLLRHNRTDEARDRLTSASITLQQIGAAPWALRAREALDATG